MPSDSSHIVPDLTDISDTTLGDFRLLRRLGIGGMAEVYLANQVSLERSVAVKVLRQDTVSGTNSTILKRFEQEARAAGGLSHPHIVQVFMIGKEGDLNYIVQEYVPGYNLSQAIKRNGPPEFLQGLKWMQDVAAALKAASDAGIVHRDIKPENIMVTRDQQAKVTDFGLAQLNEKTEKMNLTQAGTTMGTPWYMSPEQIQGEPLDHRTDQYSFGVTCYHMFAGQPPFPGRNSVSVAVQHLKEQPKPLSQHRADLPEALCKVIHRMLEKDPELRFPTPETLQEALADLENAPVNPSVGQINSVSTWLLGSLPSVKQAIIALLFCVFAGFAVGQRLFRPPRLQPRDGSSFERRESAASRQIARAILHPKDESAWKAVSEYHPTADASYWAQLQLGVHYLNKAGPDLRLAETTFSQLVARADLYGQEEVKFLAMLGRACVADKQSADKSQRDEIVRKQMSTNRELFEDNNLIAPRVLLEFRDRMLQDFRERG